MTDHQLAIVAVSCAILAHVYAVAKCASYELRLLFWKLWESRVPEFARVMRRYFRYESDRKIPLLQFIRTGWYYAKLGYEARLRKRMAPSQEAGSEAAETGA